MSSGSSASVDRTGAGPAPAAIVELQGLGRTFGSLVAVDGISLDVAPGELFGIVGPDGAGKTTIMRMLAGVLSPTSGDALVCGVSVASDPEAAKPNLAYMAQRFGLYEDLTVSENLSFYADLFRVPAKARAGRLDRLYAFSRLGEFKDRLAGQLSGGMKQKLALSCSLIHQPRLLLLDEPTFGVDPISRRELWLILHEMVAEGVTIVVSTSYLDEAERCDRVALLHQGSLLALDTPLALQRRFRGTLISVRCPDARQARDRLRTLSGISSAALFGDSVHAVLTPGGDPGPVDGALAEAGIGCEPARRVEPTLEDVFLQLVADGGPPSDLGPVSDGVGSPGGPRS